MIDPKTCSYCGLLRHPVGENAIFTLEHQKKTAVNKPVCPKCFQQLKIGKLPVAATTCDVSATEKARMIRITAEHLSKSTPLHRIQALCQEIEDVECAQIVAEREFSALADKAKETVIKIEWLRDAIEAANRCTSNPEIRNLVFGRDNCKCVKCGKDENLSIDHIIPVRLGGSNDTSNFQTLCISCNSRKGATK